MSAELKHRAYVARVSDGNVGAIGPPLQTASITQEHLPYRGRSGSAPATIKKVVAERLPVRKVGLAIPTGAPVYRVALSADWLHFTFIMIIRAIIVGLLIALAEVLNGNLRVRYLQRRFGRKRAKRLSFVTGLCLFWGIAWCLLPWIGPQSIFQCLQVGLVWIILMTALDLYFGRFVFRLPWAKIRDDFNPRKGNLLGVGLVLLFLCPAIIFVLR